MKKIDGMRYSLFMVAVLLIIGCVGATLENRDPAEAKVSNTTDATYSSRNPEFNAYWYSGKAEISTYNLEQARYDEIHPGKSTVIFVTEDFWIDKQVKKEQPGDGPSTSVLKMNKIDRFETGIYDYSLMLSTFTPIERVQYPYSLKTTFSAQDWCGQSFMQVNRRGEGYQAIIRSYFDGEGDKSQVLESGILEDELWALARLDPRALPQGDISIIPSSQELRLRHSTMRLLPATAKMNLEIREDSSEQYIYTVDFKGGRQLKLMIQTVFPYRIYGWEERVKSGSGDQAKVLTTIATIDKTIKSPYWGLNSTQDSDKRKELGLD